MSADVVVALAEVMAVIVAAIAILVALHGIKQQLWLTIFSEYTSRYSEIMEDLPFEVRDPNAYFDLGSVPVIERDRILAAARKYINLCSEELYLHTKGKIDDETWSIWHTGIRDTMRTPCFTKAWELLRPEYEFYPALMEMMDRLVEDAAPS
jgi:hypothetical protein